jgi:S-DNA-T family DNA segregation ATPase FtsK/SpoIIIE
LAQATRSKKSNGDTPALAQHVVRGLREGALLVAAAAAVYLVACLATYRSSDPGWSHSASGATITNAGGIAGAWFADLLLFLVGYMAYLFPLLVAFAGWRVYRGSGERAPFDPLQLVFRLVGFLLTMGAGSALAALHAQAGLQPTPQGSGGILGAALGAVLVGKVSFLGATLFLLALFLTGVTLLTGLSWLGLMDMTGRLTLQLLGRVGVLWRRGMVRLAAWRARRAALAEEQGESAAVDEEPVAKRPARQRDKPVVQRVEPVIRELPPLEEIQGAPVTRAAPVSRVAPAGRTHPAPQFRANAEGSLPSLTLLDPAEPGVRGYSDETLTEMSRLLELRLRDFGVDVQVVEVQPGPVITRFELQPAPGVKVSQISNLSKDLARSLSALSVRVVEVIPGKSVVGLEVPNNQREMVRLSEVLSDKVYVSQASPLTIALGKDIAGVPVAVDLARMPHLLVAGTTGSGKSVAINAMILSLLYKATPTDVRLIMIDPKMLELSVYEGIPHLLAPVVTDMKEAANALRWCVAEMDRRYRLMASLGVRNIAGYNKKIHTAKELGEPHMDMFGGADSGAAPMELQPLPYIVVIVDELADMMMVVGKKVEELIARLAQKARASGIHLILATQRPSVDVITGLIKSNVPTRISFQVSSKIDSRTILDQMGAEALLGQGDMLYLAPGTGVPTRVHGAFVSDNEVHRVVEQLKLCGEPDYIDEVLAAASEGEEATGANGDAGGEKDPLYDQAVAVVTESRRASVSWVQRRLKIGYNRAARMVEDMELAVVVGPTQSNGTREVLAPPPKELS